MKQFKARIEDIFQGHMNLYARRFNSSLPPPETNFEKNYGLKSKYLNTLFSPIKNTFANFINL